MADSEHDGSLTLTGKVVETLENEGRHFAKVQLHSCSILIALDSPPDFHLGDTVAMNATLRIQKIKQTIDP